MRECDDDDDSENGDEIEAEGDKPEEDVEDEVEADETDEDDVKRLWIGTHEKDMPAMVTVRLALTSYLTRSISAVVTDIGQVKVLLGVVDFKHRDETDTSN